MDQLIIEVQRSAMHTWNSKEWTSTESNFLYICFTFLFIKMINKCRFITASKYFNSMQTPGENYNVYEQSM